MSKKLAAIAHATARFSAIHSLALAALERDESRACLDAFCELLALYVECTGGTLVTASLRAELVALHARVEARPHLRIVPMSATQPTTHLNYRLEASAECACGAHVTVESVYASVFEARCERCWDPTEGAGELACCRGQGPTPAAALAEWAARQDEIAPGPEYWLTDLEGLVSLEAARQRGWTQTVTAEGIWHGPETLAAE